MSATGGLSPGDRHTVSDKPINTDHVERGEGDVEGEEGGGALLMLSPLSHIARR